MYTKSIVYNTVLSIGFHVIVTRVAGDSVATSTMKCAKNVVGIVYRVMNP